MVLSRMYIDFHAKYPLFLLNIKLKFSRQIFEKLSNIKFYGNPSRGSRFVVCGRTDSDITKLMVAFRNFANTRKK